MASEALEISSRRKISLLLYSEWTIRSRIWTTSAWNLWLSCPVSTLIGASCFPCGDGDSWLRPPSRLIPKPASPLPCPLQAGHQRRGGRRPGPQRVALGAAGAVPLHLFEHFRRG